jgi:hypothetical protein
MIEKLEGLILIGVSIAKYSYHGSPIVDVHINEITILKTLIDLGDTINVMTRETMRTLGITCLRQTPMLLQLADRWTVKLEAILEYVVILVYSWENPSDFMVLQPKTSLGGCPLIMGQPWLETVDAYIDCRCRSMTIFHRSSTKKISFYPPSKPIIDQKTPILVDDGEDEDEEVSLQVFSMDQYLAIKENTKDNEINDFIASTSSFSRHDLNQVLRIHAQENLSMDDAPPIPQETPTTEILNSLTELVKIRITKFSNNNWGLSKSHKKQLIEVLLSINNPTLIYTLK